MATIKPIEEEELVFPATLDEALPMKVEPELMFPATLDEALPIESKTQPSLAPKKPLIEGVSSRYQRKSQLI